MKLSQYINGYRKSAGVSQEEFAKRAGLTKGYISQIENESNPRTGKAPVPSLVTLKGIARAMGITIDVIFANVDDMDISMNGDAGDRVDELRNIATAPAPAC